MCCNGGLRSTFEREERRDQPDRCGHGDEPLDTVNYRSDQHQDGGGGQNEEGDVIHHQTKG
jgi:hypothetical protein